MTPPTETSASYMMPGIGGVSKDLIKTVLKELILEEPTLFEGLISESVEDIREEMAKTRRQMYEVQLLLGLCDDVDEEDRETIEQLQEKSTFVQDLKQTGLKRDYEKELYAELKNRRAMRNKDIVKFFGFERKDSMKATRLMRSITEKYNNVIYEPVPNEKRAFRIRLE